jgi:tetrahydromethanopterin S-methyltransferase subunit B
MIEVPLWIFVMICIATYVNVLQYLSLSSKLKTNIKQDNVNGMIVSKGFDEIAQDMDELYSKIDKLESIHEYEKNKK